MELLKDQATYPIDFLRNTTLLLQKFVVLNPSLIGRQFLVEKLKKENWKVGVYIAQG
jgi:hypothetical protein